MTSTRREPQRVSEQAVQWLLGVLTHDSMPSIDR